jgi:hypothetical protein
MILDDLIGSNECFRKDNSLISNLTRKHRHLGINLIFTTQNPKSIHLVHYEKVHREAISIFELWKSNS